MLAALKRELAEQGMAAEEIRSAIEAEPALARRVLALEDLAAFNGSPSEVAGNPRQRA